MSLYSFRIKSNNAHPKFCVFTLADFLGCTRINKMSFFTNEFQLTEWPSDVSSIQTSRLVNVTFVDIKTMAATVQYYG